ncbi:MAG: hypothetical protein ACOC3Z_00490 [Nanoarchaeota archaeon]
MNYKLKKSNGMNAPTLAHYAMSGKYRFISGRAMSHPDRKICGTNACAMIDKKIPKKPMKTLLSLKEIEMRSSCQGSQYHGPFFIFRPSKLNNDKYCDNLCDKIDDNKDLIARFGLGRQGQNRIIVTKTQNSKLKNEEWWKKAVNSVLKFFDKKQIELTESNNSSSGMGSMPASRNKPNLSLNFNSKEEDVETITAMNINKNECNFKDMIKNPKLEKDEEKGIMKINYYDSKMKQPLSVIFEKINDKWIYKKTNKNISEKATEVLDQLKNITNFFENANVKNILNSKTAKKLFIKSSKKLNNEIIISKRNINKALKDIFMKRNVKENGQLVKEELQKLRKMNAVANRMKALSSKLNLKASSDIIIKEMNDNILDIIKKITRNKHRIEKALAV